jgi:hypothetical protein
VGSANGARSLKTQQRDTSRTHPRPVTRARDAFLNEPVSSLRGDFELKPTLRIAPAKPVLKVFTESLILAQDERWRRA